MKIIISSVTLFMAILLSGCATGSTRLPDNMRNIEQGKSGYVFGVIGVGETGGFNSQSITFRAKGTTTPGYFVFTNNGIMDVPADIREGKGKAALFYAKLPVGDYEITGVKFFTNGGGVVASRTYTLDDEISIPFNIIEGHAKYLGEFIANSTTGKSVLGLPVTTGGYFMVSDHFDRDAALFKSKTGEGDNLVFAKYIIGSDTVSVPVFQQPDANASAPAGGTNNQ